MKAPKNFTHKEVPEIDQWTGNFHTGDCVEMMRLLPSESIDLIVTSPPYNLRNSTGGFPETKGLWSAAKIRSGYDTHSDNMPHAEYVKWQRDCLTEMMRVLRSDGAIFYNHKRRVQGGLCQDRDDILSGFPVRQIIIWKKRGGMNFNNGYFLPTYETIYLICNPAFKLAPKANALGDVWEIAAARGNAHPAPFPVELALRCIRSTNAEVILDPFMGSGTTALAADLCGRKWIGFEKSENYCRMAKERLSAAEQCRNTKK